MTVALAQTPVLAVQGTGGVTITLAGDTTAGNSLILAMITQVTAFTQIAANKVGGGVALLSQKVKGGTPGGNYTCQFWALDNAPASLNVQIVPSAGNGIVAWLYEVSGTLATGSFDTFGSLASGSSTNRTVSTSGSIATTNEIGIAMCGLATQTPTLPAGWTSAGSETANLNGLGCYRTPLSAGVQSVNFGSGAADIVLMMIGTFQGAAGPAFIAHPNNPISQAVNRAATY